MTATQRIIDVHRLEVKEKKGETLQKLAQHIIEKKHIYINANPLTKVLELHATKGFLHQKQKLLDQGASLM
jgi:hypothetical protein